MSIEEEKQDGLLHALALVERPLQRCIGLLCSEGNENTILAASFAVTARLILDKAVKEDDLSRTMHWMLGAIHACAQDAQESERNK